MIKITSYGYEPTAHTSRRDRVLDICPERIHADQADNQHDLVEITAAMIGRLGHHAEVVSLKGDSYRLKDRDLGRVPTATKKRLKINNQQGGRDSPGTDWSRFKRR